jgi:hypothetical protein
MVWYGSSQTSQKAMCRAESVKCSTRSGAQRFMSTLGIFCIHTYLFNRRVCSAEDGPKPIQSANQGDRSKKTQASKQAFILPPGKARKSEYVENASEGFWCRRVASRIESRILKHARPRKSAPGGFSRPLAQTLVGVRGRENPLH